jgi:hypothetical protein
MKPTMLLTIALLFCFGCSTSQQEQLTQQQNNQIKQEVKFMLDSWTTSLQKLDAAGSFKYYENTPDWGMLNADGTLWDYQITMMKWPGIFNNTNSYTWKTKSEDYLVLSKDLVIAALVCKDEAILKSGVISTCDPHAYTIICKKIDEKWKIIYQHDSGVSVMHKAEKKK